MADTDRPRAFVHLGRWFEHLLRQHDLVNNRLYQQAQADLSRAADTIAALEDKVATHNKAIAELIKENRELRQLLGQVTDQLDKQAHIVAAMGLKHNKVVETLAAHDDRLKQLPGGVQ